MFDLDKGDAKQTLKQFAKQAQIGILFNPPSISGVRTNEVVGKFTPRVALERMLEGTPLVFKEDLETGAFAVTRSEIPSPDQTTQNTEPQILEETDMKRKNNNWLRTLTAALTFGIVGTQGPVGAQELEDKEKVFDLSPFTVEEDEAQGYQAISTLAGTRIKTPLRDVGAAISVFTPEFMEDAGATDASTLLSYGLNTEVSGEQGNFAGGADTAPVRGNPQNNAQRIRGLAAASLTRGFFLTDIPFDSYNTTRVTINRGPNSLLFGVGSPGGIINNGVKQATLGSTFGEIGIRFGEHGSHRETFDYNGVLVEDLLAVRIAVMNEDLQFHQRPAYEEDSRIHAAAELRLFTNEDSDILGKTTLRINYEDGSIEGTPVNVIPPRDGFSDWFGITVDRSIEAFTGVTLPGYVDNTNDANGLFVPKTIINTLPGAPLNQHGFPNNLSAFVNIPLVFNNPDARIPSVGFQGQEDVAGVLARVFWNGTGAPRGRFEVIHSASIYSAARTPGFTRPVVLNQNILNNEDLLISGTTDFVSHDFDALNFAFEQEFFNGKGGLELVYDEQSYANFSVQPWNRDIRIDTSSHLTNDQPNPNLGKAFIWSSPYNPQETSTFREAYRATAFYEVDFTQKDGWLGWLGKHVLTGLWNEQTIDRLDLDTNFNWDSVDAPRSAQDIFSGTYGYSRRNIVLYNYLTDSLLGPEFQSAGDVRFNNAINPILPQDGDQYFLSWNDHPKAELNLSGVPAGVDITTYQPGTGDPSFYNTFRATRALAAAFRNEQVITSRALAWQSKWWNENIIGLVGWRTDKSKNTGQASTGRREDGWALPEQKELSDESEIEKGNTLTKSVVFHLPDELMDFGSTNVSFHWNESENFSPESTRRNIRGEILPTPQGATEEYGIGFEFLEGAISLRISKYIMSSSNVDANLTEAAEDILNPTGATRWGVVEAEGAPFEEIIAQSADPARFDQTYRREFQSYAEVQQAIRSYLPSDIEVLINARYEPPLPAEGATFRIDPIIGLIATRSFTSEGTEVELVGNPTRNWRVSLNIGQQETVTSDSAPLLSQIAKEVAENMKDLGLWGLQDAPDNDADETFGSRFNNSVLIPIAREQAKDGTVSLEQREWRINFATNYDFSEGALKGFGVGGAYRYQSKVATGYPLQMNADGILTPVVSSPYFGPDEWNMDFWTSYSRPITDKIDWKIQLNVRNALGDDSAIPVVTNPDGRVAVIRNSNPMDVYLSNTFRF